MSPLPVHRLPRLAFQRIADHLQIEDLFIISTISTKCKTLVETVRFSADFIDIHWLITNYCISIDVHGKRWFELSFRKLDPLDRQVLRSPKAYAGCQVQIDREHPGVLRLTCLSDPEVERISRSAYDFAMKIFKSKTTKLYMKVPWNHREFREFVDKYNARNFEYLRHPVDENEHLSREELRSLMEDFRLDSWEAKFHADKYYGGALPDSNEVILKSASWLTLDCILNMKTLKLRVEGSELTTKEFNQLVKSWRAGAPEQMCSCHFKQSIGSIWQILEGVEHEEYNGESNGNLEDFEPSQKRVIQRDDGKKAVVGVKAGQFVMWTL